MKQGFTLSEVLITLGIVGVVSAITLPVVINNAKNVITTTRLKKAYSEISQAFNRITEEDEIGSVNYYMSPIDNSTNWLSKIYDNAIKTNMKIIKTCLNQAGCFSNETKTISGNIPYSLDANNISFVTADGYSVHFQVYSFFSPKRYGVMRPQNAMAIGNGNLYMFIIYIDINGLVKPNVLGRDTFTMLYFPGLGVVPLGKDESDSVVNANCNKNSAKNDSSEVAGFYCLSKIIRDGWKIKY